MDQPVALDTFRQVRDQFLGDRISRLRSAGVTDEQLTSPETVTALREGVVNFMFQGMGPGTEFNYDVDIIAEAARRLGFNDLVSETPAGPQPLLASDTREGQKARAAQTVAAALEQRKARAETAQQLQGRIQGAGAREVFPKMGLQDLSEGVRQFPAMISTAIKQIESVPLQLGDKMVSVPNPFFDAEVRKDPKFVQQATVLRVEGYDLAGVDKLVDAGVPHWLADIVVEDTLDPTSWVFGNKPLAIAAGALAAGAVAGAGALGSRLLFKTLRANFRNGTRMTGEELVDFARRVVAPFEAEIAREPGRQLVELGDLPSFGVGKEGDAKKAFERFVSAMGDGPTRRGDSRLLNIVNDLYDADMVDAANEMLDLRMMMMTDPDEVADFQKLAASKLGKRADPSVLRRADLKEVFLDLDTNQLVEVEAGLVGRYLRNPEDFVTAAGQWKGRQGRLLSGLLGGKSAGDAAQDAVSLRYVGRSRAVQQAIAGLEWASVHAPEELRDVLGQSNILSGIRKAFTPSSSQLQRTPVFRPLVFGGVARNAERGAWNLRLHAALGGEVYSIGDALTDLAYTGGQGVRLKNHSPLMPKNRSMFSPGRLIDRGQRAAARDLGDQLVWFMGDNLHKEAVNLKRVRDGLDAITDDLVDSRVAGMANNVRILWDELGEESARLGLVDPSTFVQSYLPRIYENMRSGLSLDEAIGKIRKGDGPVAFEADPFFARLRHGENPEDLLTDLPRMMEIYVDTLTKHKYIKPIVTDMIKTITSSASSMSIRDRFMAMEFLHHQLGGTTRTQAKLAANTMSANESLRRLAEQGGDILRNFDELSADGRSIDGFVNWASRQMTDMLYTNFIGAKLGLPVRNLTQQALGIPMMGGSIKGWNHLRRGIRRIGADRALYEQYLERSRLWSWHNETFEFAEESFGTFNKKYPDLIPLRWKQQVMGWYQLSDMQNRANVWAGGYDYAEDVIRRIRDGKKPNWKNSAAAFTTEERNALARMVEAGDYEGFKVNYADATVNNSQWLYNRKNRPLWAQENPVLGTALVFMTWPMNFAAAGWRAASGGKAALPGLELARLTKRGLGFLAPLTVVGGALEYGGRASGIGGMGDWLFPDLAEVSKQWKSDMGYEQDEKALIPIPVKPLTMPVRTITGEEPLGGSLPVLRMWFEGARAGAQILRSGSDDFDSTERAKALQQFFKATPLTPQGLQFLTGPLLEELGVEPDVEMREGIFQEVLGAMFQLQESEGLEADFRKSQALPKVPGEVDRYLVPIEGSNR